MSELRQDRTTDGWVVIAPQRRRRPHRWVADEPQPEASPAFEAACPFCPGHEAELPGIIAETPAKGAPAWSVRVVPNKFPALEPQPQAQSQVFACGHRALPGYGFHEVVIESPRHNADPATMTAPELQAVVAMYRQRSQVLLGQDGIETVVVFRNHGSKGGASLTHPHSQIVALGLIPPKLNAMIGAGQRHLRAEGRCAMCAELEIAVRDGKRVVEETGQFVALVPFAAEYPFELWIAPKRHQASFAAIGDDELEDFAALLGSSLRRLQAALHYPPYNFVVDTAPRSQLSAPYLHWRLRIVPKIESWAGFELGTGLPINPSSPEGDASTLRAVAMEQIQPG